MYTYTYIHIYTHIHTHIYMHTLHTRIYIVSCHIKLMVTTNQKIFNRYTQKRERNKAIKIKIKS